MSSIERQTIKRLTSENIRLRDGIAIMALQQETMRAILGLGCAFRILGDIYVEARKAPEGIDGYWWVVRRKLEVLSLKGAWALENKEGSRTDAYRRLFYHEVLEEAINAGGAAASAAYNLPALQMLPTTKPVLTPVEISDWSSPEAVWGVAGFVPADRDPVAMADQVVALVEMHGYLGFTELGSILAFDPGAPVAGYSDFTQFAGDRLKGRLVPAVTLDVQDIPQEPGFRAMTEDEKAGGGTIGEAIADLVAKLQAANPQTVEELVEMLAGERDGRTQEVIAASDVGSADFLVSDPVVAPAAG